MPYAAFTLDAYRTHQPRRLQPRHAMRPHAHFILFSVFTSILCLSCKQEDPQLVAKREQQQREIVRLKGELAQLEEQLQSLPPDVTAELEAATKQVEQNAAAIASLETEAADLEQRNRVLQQEFDAYRAKFPLPKSPTQPR